MRRLQMVALTMIGLFLATPVIAWAGVDPSEISTLGKSGDSSVSLWAKKQLARQGKSERREIKTRFTAVCKVGDDDLAAADVCHRATTLCKLGDKAYWRQTAPVGTDTWTTAPAPECMTPAEAGVPVLTQKEFRKLPIPAAKLQIQPDPDTAGPTLVNIPTNLYTRRTVPILQTTLLGQPVRVRATPTTYTWSYGDASRLTTRDTGGPYPDLSLGHTYSKPGRYEIALETTFTGEYSVNGGPWQPVEGTATVATDPRVVQALQARSQLTS